MKRTLLAVAAVALAATPALAGPVYVPSAINETDGAYRRTTELWVTNPEGDIQGFVVRRLAGGADGTVRADGDEIGPYYLAAGETRRFTDLVPSGFRGMLEIDGSTSLQFNGVLTTHINQSIVVSESEIPVLTQADLAVAGDTLVLQGLERLGTTTTTNLGLVNMGGAEATCTVSLRQKDGLLILQNVPLPVAALSVAQFDDAFGILNLSVVPQGARAEISCNQPFWVFYSTYDDLTGAVEFFEPSSSIGRSTLVKPTENDPPPPPPPGDDDPPSGDAVVFTRNGQFVSYPTRSWALNNYRVSMPFGGSRTFKKVTVDFDFHVGGWDSHNSSGFHCIFWLNNGQSWNNMFGYVNTRGSRGLTVFQVNATGGGWQETSQSSSPGTNSNYHMRYVYDLTTHEVSYEITRASGGRVVGKSYTLRGNTFSTNSFFIEFGAQYADEGPEAYTPGWTFSNFRAVFTP